MKIIKYVFAVSLFALSFSNLSNAAQTNEMLAQGSLSADFYPYPNPYPQNVYYDWGQGQDGFAYCYEYTADGRVLNAGQPVAPYNCEARHPSHATWGRGQDGWGYCFQYSPYNIVMNAGQPISDYICEASQASHYAWGSGQDGYTRCYHYTSFGVPMNQGMPVANNYCQ